jgi:tetratricopeptide (TPR) repeat protein
VAASSPSPAWWPRLLPAAAIGALLLPAHHVMNDRVNPIFYLYHELAALDNPPPTAMPELYELRAIHEMERGEFAQADADLALAMKLAPNPASPSKQRGILAASQRHWADALKYFSILAEHDPQNPDAWFMCSQAHLALGDAPAAQSSFQHAASLAPTEWTTRPDVARFMANLNMR